MSRYLTPPKVCLLALISLYCDSTVPSPATVPILSFIVSHVLPLSSSPNDPQSNSSPNFPLLIEDFERATIPHAASIPGRTVWDLFLRKLWSINCFEALHEFFDDLETLLRQPSGNNSSNHAILLSRTSPFGVFVRRAQLEFTRLQFDDAAKLWSSYLVYKEPTEIARRRRFASGAGPTIDINIQDLNLQPGDALLEVAYGRLDEVDSTVEMTSAEDVENILEFQLDQLQSAYTVRK